MKTRRSADSDRFLESLPKPSHTNSCSHHGFGRNPEDSLQWELPEAKLLARNNFQLATQPGAIVITSHKPTSGQRRWDSVPGMTSKLRVTWDLSAKLSPQRWPKSFRTPMSRPSRGSSVSYLTVPKRPGAHCPACRPIGRSLS